MKDSELRKSAVEEYIRSRKRGGSVSASEVRAFLLSLPVYGEHEQRAWNRVARHKAFWLRLGRGEKARLLFVDGGGWCRPDGGTVHVGKLLKTPRPEGLGTV